MLNEWYTTHDTRDATLAVLTALQDMGREDAAVMVEIAMKNTGGVGTSVQDETFEYSTPRDIFISYPPGSQNEAQSLKEHLEMAGYTCWLDLEHLEVEDELFQKIQSRIEEVKVVICCINEDYFKSHVCEKEVTISAQLEKPIIPLLSEETSWPPSGNMGAIFNDNFYINFFQSPDKTTESSGYWSSSIFQELLWELMCLKDLVRNTAFVRPEYRYWWDPELEATRVDTQDGKPNDKLEKPCSCY
ncbi:uncharacterized protein LOC112554514 isoform X2 [Pomacea canaliculata]|uniref:uncharacterized protein LOC112554514 isoform X2 n=1 Tax=Pomacea canaliculata TaxID=400727 RepID=UPI000D73C5B4|nr:uncharacterized protein LOC112554514 isoform X2 [Pomacea canaliculata]